MADNTASLSKGMANRTLSLELETKEKEAHPVYMAGNFNDWKERDDKYRLKPKGEGRYRIEIPVTEGFPQELEYKYMRGGWEDVELDRYGNATPNRKVNIQSGLVYDQVFYWKRNGLEYLPSLLPEIRIISENFEIPQLIKTRRIAALLPHDYSQTDRRYPVLYLQDGQNLFDEHAPFGNWAVDKKLAMMSEHGYGDLIIVAIDHAEEERIAEFTPSSRTRLGWGDGKKYLCFLADTLKPYIDKYFRTLPDRTHTGIGGSSMGGLISIYAGFMYPEVYGKLMVFSPSLWVEPNIHFHSINLYEAADARIYLYAGEEESKNMVPNVKKFKRAVEQQGIEADIKFRLSIDPNGKHNEKRWGEEFPRAVEWLFNF